MTIPKKYKGIIFIIMAAFFFAMMSAFVRLAGDVPTMQKSFFRNAVALVFAFIILKKDHIPLGWQKGSLKYHLIRSACGTLGILCNFYAVDHMNISDASMLNKMSPFFAIIFSLIFLREKTTIWQIGFVACAFIGALFIIKPSFADLEFLPAVIGFMGGMGAGAAYTAVRHMGTRGEKGPFIVFFFSSFSCLVTLPYLIFAFKPMTLMQTVFLLGAGLSAAGGQFSITAAYCNAPAKEISIFDYSQIIFAAMLGFFLFGQVPDYLSFIGYGVIIVSAVGMFLYNNRKTT